MLRQKLTELFGGALPLAAILLTATLAAWLLVAQNLQPADQAYINFEHVKNFLKADRLSFSLQDRPVLGTESPAYVVVLTLFSNIFHSTSPDKIALYLNGGLLFFIVFISFLMMKNILQDPLLALLGATLVGFHSACISIYSAGFETGMLLLVLLLSFYFAVRNRAVVSVLLASIAPLIGLDGILATLLVPAYLIFYKKRSPVWILFAAVIPLAWMYFCAQYYGSPFPQPLLARLKLSPGPLGFQHAGILNSVNGIMAHYAAGHRVLLAGSFVRDDFGFWGYVRLAICMLGLITWLRQGKRGENGELFFFAYPLLFSSLHLWIGSDFWYFASFVSLGLLLYFSICSAGWRDLLLKKGFGGTDPRSRKFFLIAGYVALFVLLLFSNVYVFDIWSEPWLQAANPRGQSWTTWERQRYNSYRRAVEFLKKQSHAESKNVLVSEAGFFGYYYPGNVIDSSGRFSPRALRYYPLPYSDLLDEKGNYTVWPRSRIPSQLVRDVKPDYVVSSVVFIRHLLAPDSDFLKNYNQIASAGYVWWARVLIFERKNPHPGP